MSRKSKNSLSAIIIAALLVSLSMIFWSSIRIFDINKKYNSLMSLENQVENLHIQHDNLIKILLHSILHQHLNYDQITSEIEITRAHQETIDLTLLPEKQKELFNIKSLSEIRLNKIQIANETMASKARAKSKDLTYILEELDEDALENELISILNFTHLKQKEIFKEEHNSKTLLILAVSLTLIVILFSFISLYYTNTSLKEKEHLLQRQKNNLDIANLVSETDAKGIITYVNDQFCKVSKYSRDELIGSSHAIVNSGFHDNKFWQGFWNTIKSGQVWKGEVCNKAKDGSLYWVQTSIVPMHDEKGRIIGYSSIRTDITDKKQAESQLLHSQKLASIGELSASIGHEINNPLMIIGGNAKKILTAYEQGVPFTQIKDSSDDLTESIARIKIIIEGLRTYARADSLTVETVDLHTEITNTLRLIKSVFHDNGIDIISSLDAEKHLITGNKGRIQQVLMNLLTNARDAIENSATKKITIRTENEDQNILIHIVDTGKGIPENIQNKIYEPYFTTKEAGKGTGLGLGISTAIIRELGGEISFKSEAKKGTVFTVSFPQLKEKESDSPLATTEKSSNSKISGNALIVDDEKGIRRILQEELEDIGLSVDQTDSGEKALERLQNKKYDYIFTDMQMPLMTGFEFIQKAVGLDNGKTNYYVISGGQPSALNDEQKQWLNRNICGYINKPFGSQEILNALQKRIS